jgi:hypothetical protein
MTSTEIDPAANKDYFGNSIQWDSFNAGGFVD